MEDHFANALSGRRQFLEQLMSAKRTALAAAPEGRLRCTTKDGIPQYYHVIPSGDPAGRYIPAADRDLRKALAQKKYDLKVMKNAEEEVKIIIKLQEYRTKRRPEDVYEDAHPARRSLITPIFQPDDQFAARWQEYPYQKPGFEKDDDTEFYSGKGERMRSKSEVFIADKLDGLGIPYRYEQPMYLKGLGWVNPDFTVLNVRLRKVMIWEHFGKMDDENYSRKNLRKLEYYERNGWFSGDNFILTMETKARPLSSLAIERVARHYLL